MTATTRRRLYRSATVTANPDANALGGPHVDRNQNAIFGARIMERGELQPGDARTYAIDDTTLQQLITFGNRPKTGLKARFTHPNMSDDGLANYLGRWRNFRLTPDGDAVLADLHLADSAFDTPNGDLASYVLDRAEEDPESFGVSAATLPAAEMFDEDDPPAFLRLAGLYAADFVDTPAATSGLFSAFQNADPQDPRNLAAAATWFLDRHFPDADPAEVIQRFTDFAARYYGAPLMDPTPATHDDLADLDPNTADTAADTHAAEPAPAAPPAAEPAPADTAAAGDYRAQGALFIEHFGDQGARWFLEGHSLADCFAMHCDQLAAQIEALEAENDDLRAQLRTATANLGEAAPLDASPPVELNDRDRFKAQRQHELIKQGIDPSEAALAASFEAKRRFASPN